MTRQSDNIQLMATPHTTRRRLIVASSTFAALGFTGCLKAQTTITNITPHLRLIGQTPLPHKLHKLQFQSATVGGLSGVDYDQASGTYYLLSDDGGSISPPRFYTARIASTADKLGDIELTGVIFLQDMGAPEPDAIRWHPPSHSLLWTSEGNAVRSAAPSLQRTRLDGSLVRTFALPAMFDFGLLGMAKIMAHGSKNT